MPDGNQATQAQTPYFALAAEIVAGQQVRRAEAARKSSGVRRSGMDADLPLVERVEDVAQRLSDLDEACETYRQTPRGRFWAAVNRLGELGWSREAAFAANIFDRFLRDPSREIDALAIDGIGRAIRVLAPINHSDAREALAALADMLAPALARAA